MEHEDSEIYQCTDCGVDVDKDAEICPKCGVNFKEQSNENQIYTGNNKKAGFGLKIIGFIVTLLVLTIGVSIKPILKYFNNPNSIEYSDYDDWEKISLYDIGIILKTPVKLSREISNLDTGIKNGSIYYGKAPGFELVLLGGTIEDGYFYDLEKGAIGTMKSLEKDELLTNLNYTMSEWSQTSFENKVVRGTYDANGAKGDLLSLIGKKNNKIFSVLVLVNPTNPRALDLAHLLLLSVEFKSL